jgi:general L-amino acid transport system substrate-binding protein
LFLKNHPLRYSQLRTRAAAVAIATILIPFTGGIACAATLPQVRAAGALRCGIDIEQAEYSTSDDHGNRAAFDADLCRAVAIAVLGSKAQVESKTYPDDAAVMTALRSGEVDLIPTLTDDFSHQTGTHLAFTRPVLWDGVGFLLPTASPITRTPQLSGKKICFLAETTVEESVRAWFAREHLDFVPFPFQEEGEMQAAFNTGNCGALAGDRTRLAQTRAALLEHGRKTRLLPESISPGSISKDPLAAAVRDDDPQWIAIVNWVMEALVQAEESGITQANARHLQALAPQEPPQEKDPLRRFLLGESHQIGTALSLDDDWVVNVIEATGNYGEIYERDLGASSPMKLPRGANKLARDGGLIVALPPK